MKKLSLIVVVALLSSCSSLMMSVKDRDSANKHMIVKPGEQVAVHMPEIGYYVSEGDTIVKFGVGITRTR